MPFDAAGLDVVAYAASLYERRHEAVVVPSAKLSIGDWTPAANDCHANAQTVALSCPEYEAVRGWLYFDFVNDLPFVRFSAHSVILNSEGQLFEITPSPASQDYPFLVEDREAIFDELIGNRGLSHIDHFK
jgi:hypothetical protein